MTDTIYPIGLEFRMKRGKQSPRECEIVDVHTTTNSAGEIVKIRYVAAYEFMGQVILDKDVCAVTIARALDAEGKPCAP